MKNKKYGFTAIELLLALSVIAALVFMSIRIANKFSSELTGDSVARDAYQYSKSVERYINTHYSLLQELLTINNGQSNGLIVTIPETILKNEGFINSSYPNMNVLNQIPCAVIVWSNNRLQSFLYYRGTNQTRTLGEYELNRGMQYTGAMIGVYKNGVVQGALNLWNLDQATTENLLIAKGTADPSQGVNPDAYQCGGDQIVNNSYVIDIVITQILNNKLAHDDNLHQYNDDGSQVDDPQNANTMESDLNMDYRTANGQHIKSNMIFQMNPDCVMDPSDIATMQDYSSDNPRGCKNRQLALETSRESNNVDITVTGFQQGGNNQDLTQKPYMGSLSALSIQPTAEVQIGTPCQISELGKMAKQQISSDPNDVNNLYISQVQCMKNPLCSPSSINETCYMPVNNVTIEIETKQDSYNSVSAMCPAGTFVYRVDADSAAITPGPCGSCHIDPCNKGGGACSTVQEINPLASPNPILYSGIQTTPSRWYQGCPTIHPGCNEGWGNAPDTYIIVRSMTCTNDISKVGVIVNQ